MMYREENLDVLPAFLESLNNDNYVSELDLDDAKVKYKLIIQFDDNSNDKYVINVYDKNTVTLFHGMVIFKKI